jgi:hypothetical protein
MTTDGRLSTLITLSGLGTLALGVFWWWVVFEEVVANGYISYSQAATCIGGSSDLCALAHALCKSNHWLGVTTYSSVIFWAGLATISAGIALRSAKRPV